MNEKDILDCIKYAIQNLGRCPYCWKYDDVYRLPKYEIEGIGKKYSCSACDKDFDTPIKMIDLRQYMNHELVGVKNDPND